MRFQLKLPVGSAMARMGRDSLASIIALLIANGEAASRADLARTTGLSRSMIEPAVNTLIELGAVLPTGLNAVRGRGRPGEILALDPDYCLILAADCGFAHCTLAVMNLQQQVLASDALVLSRDKDADVLLTEISQRLLNMVQSLGLDHLPRRMVFGSPGLVDRAKGEVFPPVRSATSSWDGYPVATRMAELIGGPVQMEHDVALRALGEAYTEATASGSLAYIKVSTGIGLALVSAEGRLELGADGFAGQISHVKVTDIPIECPCGNLGCLNAVASMFALADELGVTTDHTAWSDEVLNLIKSQDPRAMRAVKRAGEYIGQAIVDLIHFINPERVIIGGSLATNSDHLLAGVRSIVYTRGLPVTTRNLTVSAPSLGAQSGIAGALAVAILTELSPAVMGSRLDGLGRQRSISAS